MAKKTLHFKSREAYRRWLAYGHMKTKKDLKVSVKAPGTKVVVTGKSRKVKHSVK